MSFGVPYPANIGDLFYTHDGYSFETVNVYATRVGRIPYGNTVNIFRVERGKDLSSAKLAMFGVTLMSSQQSFNLGQVKVNPGDRLYAYMDRKGLTFKAVLPKVQSAKPFDQFADLFD